SVRALVVCSGKKEGFIAGAEIKEIAAVTTAAQASELSRQAQRSLAKIEAMHARQHKPVIAALHGSVLGGGLEVALCCSGRIGADGCELGLPEVKLGLIPGAGGTQRLPRLIGVANALDLILTGKTLRAAKARKLGLLDEVVPAAILLDVARRRAREACAASASAGPKRLQWQQVAHDLADPAFLQQVALEENPLGLRLLFQKARQQLQQKTRGNYPAPQRALEVVRIGLQEGLEAGFAAEADRFGQLAMTPHSASLRHLFFSMQALKKETGVSDPSVTARAVDKVGILGGGLMGAGIAAVSLMQGKMRVRIKEVDDRGVGLARAYVHKLVVKQVERRRLSPHQGDATMQRLSGSLDLRGFASAQLVIEAVFEDLALKQEMLRHVEEVCPADTIFASNTSAISIASIAAHAKHPERVIGMHYFSPVEKMPLLEVVVADKTAEWVTATCVRVGQAQGKVVICVRDAPGFYTTRLIAAYLTEAAWVLREGVAMEAVDEAMLDFGFPVGPVTLFDARRYPQSWAEGKEAVWVGDLDLPLAKGTTTFEMEWKVPVVAATE
ncbi:MAG: fatty acid oxidation complex subunit alpha FadJ, partial [Deltaproteobacteria bacterium]